MVLRLLLYRAQICRFHACAVSYFNLVLLAVGPDSISNELLKLASDDIILNLNIEKGMTCSEWYFDLVSLIHKEGPKNDPNNYRGNTLLNNRITTYCVERKLINPEQIGFQTNNRTSDRILTLKAVVNKYVVEQKGKKLYTCLFCRFPKSFRFYLA